MEMIEFLREAGKLKTVKRTGWIAERVKDPESVADHSFMIALLAMVLGPQRKINVDKAVKMALIHDLAECRTGDILVDWKVRRYQERGLKVDGNHGISKAEKHELEKRAFSSLTKKLPGGKELFSLWMEFEKGKSPEAVFVKSLDRLEMLLQALRYQELDIKHWLIPENMPQDPFVLTVLQKILEKAHK